MFINLLIPVADPNIPLNLLLKGFLPIVTQVKVLKLLMKIQYVLFGTLGGYMLLFGGKKPALRIHWRFPTILKISNKSVWSNVFWYVKVCIIWKCIQYTIHWDKTPMLKKIPLDKINGTKNALFFLPGA